MPATRRASKLALAMALCVLALAATASAATGSRDAASSSSSSADHPPVLEPGSGGDGAEDEKVRRITFGETVKLDHLGPIIVHEDCSMRRIANWESLTEREKKGTQRRVAERNRGRLEKCRELEAQGKLKKPLDEAGDVRDVEDVPDCAVDENSPRCEHRVDHDEL